MRRKSVETIKKDHRWSLCFGIILFLIAALMLYFPLSEGTVYHDSTITVREFDRHLVPARTAAEICTVKDADGGFYIIGGENCDPQQLEAELKVGKAAYIRYTENRLLPIRYMQEITLDGKIIYPDTDGARTIPVGVGVTFSVIFVLLGAICLLLRRYSIRHEIKMQENRDLRIRKKYGDKTK